MENIVTAKKKKTRILIGAAVALVFCALLALILGVASGRSADKLAKQLELGQRYLGELDYEQAVIAYEAALEIEPKNEDAYLGLAEAYIAMGDSARAIEILEEGYAQTGSGRIARRLAELKEALQAAAADRANASDDSQIQEIPGEVQEQAPLREDQAIDWKDANLEAAMRRITGIAEGDILLKDVQDLTELYLQESQISDISALAALTNLTVLYLNGNQISDVSPLSGLNNLELLWLNNNQISDISPLPSANLAYLDLGQNQISDISELARFTNLIYLNISANQISDVSALSGFDKLDFLGAVQNQINDVSALASLTTLTQLWLDYNQISDVSPLASLTNLTTLGLSRNQISDVSTLASLTNLATLGLAENPVNDLEPVSFVENLVTE